MFFILKVGLILIFVSSRIAITIKYTDNPLYSDGRGAGCECAGNCSEGEYRVRGPQLVCGRRSQVQGADPQQVREGEQCSLFHC